LVSHVSLVTLGVSDVDAATAFYTRLGWRASSASVAGEITFFHGPVVLAVWDRGELARDAGLEEEAPTFAGVALAVNLGSREAVDEFLGDVADAGGEVVKPAQATEWGGYSGYFTDPDGHLWEVAHNPGWPLNADGSVTLPA
jgi:uncharacterized protein